MTAWQCGGQGFESPQLHPSEQGFLCPARFQRSAWLQLVPRLPTFALADDSGVLESGLV
jgi:hypothetical protein